MPTMTIMTSYPDASPDEVDEMVAQKDRIGSFGHHRSGVDDLHLQ